MMMNLLNPNQKLQTNQFQSKSREEQAQMIADICNQKGISKEQLQQMLSQHRF